MHTPLSIIINKVIALYTSKDLMESLKNGKFAIRRDQENHPTKSVSFCIQEVIYNVPNSADGM